MKLKVNPEFFKRHLAVTLLMAGLGCWFGYDGLVRYPATDAAALYESIEKSPPPAEFDLVAFKAQKIRSQHGLALAALIAAAAIGLHLWAVCRFEFEYDDETFTYRGRRRKIAEIASVDRSKWEKKGIVRVDGITLDAWHHLGVREFHGMLKR